MEKLTSLLLALATAGILSAEGNYAYYPYDEHGVTIHTYLEEYRPGLGCASTGVMASYVGELEFRSYEVFRNNVDWGLDNRNAYHLSAPLALSVPERCPVKNGVFFSVLFRSPDRLDVDTDMLGEGTINSDGTGDATVCLSTSVKGKPTQQHILFHPFHWEDGEYYCLTLVERKDRPSITIDKETRTVSIDGRPYMTCLFKDVEFSATEMQNVITFKGTTDDGMSIHGGLRYRAITPGASDWTLGWVKRTDIPTEDEYLFPRGSCLPPSALMADHLYPAAMEWDTLDLGDGHALRHPARMTIDRTRLEGIDYDVVRLRDPESRFGVAYCPERIVSSKDGKPATPEEILTENFLMGMNKPTVYTNGKERVCIFCEQWHACAIAAFYTEDDVTPTSVKVRTLTFIFPCNSLDRYTDVIHDMLQSVME